MRKYCNLTTCHIGTHRLLQQVQNYFHIFDTEKMRTLWLHGKHCTLVNSTPEFASIPVQNLTRQITFALFEEKGKITKYFYGSRWSTFFFIKQLCKIKFYISARFKRGSTEKRASTVTIRPSHNLSGEVKFCTTTITTQIC